MTSKENVKLQYNGKSYRVTIPSKIIQKTRWGKGDPLQMVIDNESLVLKKSSNGSMIFSTGYEGMAQREFIDRLVKNHIQQLIDVRQIPNSRKKGFAKSILAEELAKYGIMYIHIPELGTDKVSRDNYRVTNNVKKLLNEYEKRFQKHYSSYEVVRALAKYKTSAIMCFEDDHQFCHRQRIESELEKDGFSVVHLCNGKQRKFL